MILVAGYVGGSLQFLMARGALRPFLVGLPRPRGTLRRAARLPRSVARGDGAGGAWRSHEPPRACASARSAASGLAALPFSVFLPGLVAGNAVFVGGHFALGYAIGPTATDLIAGGSAVAAGLVAFVALAAAGALGWSFLRRRRTRALSATTQPDAEGGAFAAWADTACPACLALAVTDDIDPVDPI